MTITAKQFFECADIPIEQHREFEIYLEDILFDKPRREAFYKALQQFHIPDKQDTFQDYFENYVAERKSFSQDFTPRAITNIVARLTQNTRGENYTAYDPTAGTGALIIAKWWENMTACHPFEYHPSEHFYLCEEKADNTIPYLLHNLIMRGINAIVIHGDTLERRAKNIYFIYNKDDDYLHFSEIGKMPKNHEVEKEFNILEWY